MFKSSVGIGPYIEVAFFHKRTRSLLVTDAVVSVPEQPPEVRPGRGVWRGSCVQPEGSGCEYAGAI